jgi:cytochrome c oxidase assembly protein subunit 15
LTIALAAALWFGERRTWLRWLGVTALLLVIAQGILGGLRVVLLQNTLAIIHACLAQAFFALTVGLALFTSREWTSEPTQAPIADSGRLVQDANMRFQPNFIVSCAATCQTLEPATEDI